jgi:hypothetical protein
MDQMSCFGIWIRRKFIVHCKMPTLENRSATFTLCKMSQFSSLRQLMEIPSKCGFLKKVYQFQDYLDKDQVMLNHHWKLDFTVAKTIQLCMELEICYLVPLMELWEISAYWMNSKAWISLPRILNREESEMKKAMVFLGKFRISVSRNKEKEIGKMS